MHRPKIFQTILIFALILALGLAGCSPTREAAGEDQPVELVVFAASSLTDAVNQLSDTFEAAHPNVTVVRNFASSSNLAAQLVEGIEADVFASANETQMQVVVNAGRISTPAQIFATNRLTAIVPADNPAGIGSVADLANPGIALILAAPGVPVRQYTDQAITNLAADPAYGEAFSTAVYANLVSEEDNVRQVAAKVALGEADAGVVYTSDVTPDIVDDVQMIAIPDAYNVIATYPIGILDDAPYPDVAAQFIEFILSPDGQAILQHWGFGPTPE
jgi:molybdate transport system substrate-binding protein